MINEQDSFIEDIDTSTFVEKVIKESKNLAVIVDFWAPWCEPCKQITPTLEQLTRQYQGKLKLVKVNIDDNQQLAQQLNIQSIPTVMAFYEGQPVNGFAGMKSPEEIKAFFDEVISVASVSSDMMNDLITQGKILYWGTSEWSAAEIDFAYKVSDKLGLRGPTMEQPQYNLLYRERFEKEYAPIFEKYGLGTTIWSPLASGVLSGKYMKRMPNMHRFKVKGYEWLQEELLQDSFLPKLNQINNLAKQMNVTMAQLSIAWCLKNKNVSSVILGASKKSQLKENLESLNVYNLLTEEICNILDK